MSSRPPLHVLLEARHAEVLPTRIDTCGTDSLTDVLESDKWPGRGIGCDRVVRRLVDRSVPVLDLRPMRQVNVVARDNLDRLAGDLDDS